MEIVVYIFFLGVWLLVNYKKYGFNGASFLIALYFIGAVLGLYMIYATNLYDQSRLNIWAVIYHLICLLLFLYPIVYITNRYVFSFEMPPKHILRILYFMIIGFSILTFISIVPKVGNILKMDNLQEARNMYNYGMLNEEGGGLLDYFGAFGSAVAYIAMYLFFYNLTNYPEKKKLITVLLLCSMTDAMTSLAVVGRGGIMRWGLMFLFFYCTFRPLIDPKLRTKALKIIGIVSLPLLIIFLSITFSRFSNREYPVYVYMFDYIGQSYIYFSYMFNDFYESTFGGRLSFPFLFPNDRLEGHVSNLVYADFSLNTFSTFVGSFYKDMGFMSTISLAFCFWLLFFFLYRFNKKPIIFYKLILYIIFSQMIVNGVFYFQYQSTTKMKTFIVLVIMSIFVSIIYPRQKKWNHSKIL